MYVLIEHSTTHLIRYTAFPSVLKLLQARAACMGNSGIEVYQVSTCYDKVDPLATMGWFEECILS